ncbi:hypothetical protein A3Q56_03849 [Intoshia linei]|uniref:Major facilitator superfamily (MFS) profile domain-containing protein n=1 Tax=Intoshia linei TaxID=1819745 RepID=A0A177B2F4_9BILA|nr:hypothetical protein A3Q56_03849 [Intoshia linei]
MKLSKTIDGSYGILIIFAAYIFYFITDGWAFSLPLIFKLIKQRFGIEDSNINIFSTLIFAIPSLSAIFICGLIKKTNYRFCAIMGTLIFSIPLMCYPAYKNWTTTLCLISIVSSFGIGLFYMVAYLSIINFFDKRQGIALSFTTLGSASGGIAFPFIIHHTYDKYSDKFLLVIAIPILIICALLSFIFCLPTNNVKIAAYRRESVLRMPIQIIKSQNMISKIFNVLYLHIFKIKKLNFFFLSIIMLSLILSNGFIYVALHLEMFLDQEYITKHSNILSTILSCMSLSRGFGLLIIGLIIDYTRISYFIIFSFCLFIIGMCYLAMAVTTNFYLLVTLYAVYAFFYSSFYMLPVFCIGIIHDNYQDYYFTYSFSGAVMLISSYMLILLGINQKQLFTRKIAKT